LLVQLGARATSKDGKWFAVERKDDPADEILASRLEVLGPVAAPEDALLLALEGQGRILRGRFSSSELEWCDRRLLARIHRYTLNRLRAEIEPVTAAEFMRFLTHWQHVAGEDRVRGADGLAAVVEQLEGFELAAAAWESDVLPARVTDFEPAQIDQLCLTGKVAWGRLSAGTSAPLKSSPIGLMLRAHSVHADLDFSRDSLSPEGKAVHEKLRQRGASFFNDLVAATGQLPSVTERALAELVGAGLVTADGFAGLRALLAAPEKRKGLVEAAGRWALLSNSLENNFEAVARTLLKRYGVVFRSLLQRETRLPPWRDLVRVYRRLEARGEIRGGRFVKGFGGEQFAAADAVGRLRAVRKMEPAGEMLALSGADPLNLVGILTPDSKVSSLWKNRILLRDGVAIAALEGGELRRLAACELDDATLKALAARRSHAPLHPYLRALSGRKPKAPPLVYTSF
jgi:ATP-dependent Lhr-like helicase